MPSVGPPGSSPRDARPAGRAVIFLDVDGVLHPLDPRGLPARADFDELTARSEAELDLDSTATASVVRGEFEEENMRAMRACVAECGASIVLSTTWRETEPQRRAVDQQLVKHGLPASIGCTPRLPLLEGGRPAEIEAWVREHRPARWVAIDDQELDAERAHARALPAQHFVRTDPARGFTAEDAARVKELLRVYSP